MGQAVSGVSQQQSGGVGFSAERCGSPVENARGLCGSMNRNITARIRKHPDRLERYHKNFSILQGGFIMKWSNKRGMEFDQT